jgi:hypothetical protein
LAEPAVTGFETLPINMMMNCLHNQQQYEGQQQRARQRQHGAFRANH